MAITYTDNLTLPIVPADNQDWAADYNTMIEKLDRNPGIRIVADEAAMVALTTFTGRMCWRTALSQYWYYDGTQWTVLPGQEEGDLPAFMPMKDTEQEVTAEVAAEGSQDGTIDFDYYPGVGEEVQLYMLKVTLDADEVPVENEEVIMEEETAKRLEHKHARSIDDTGDEVTIHAVKDSDSMGEVQTLNLGGAEPTAEVQTLFLDTPDGGTYDLGLDLGGANEEKVTLNWNDNAATIETALEGIFGAGNVTVAPDTDFTITFDTSVEDSNLDADFAALTNATSPSLSVTTAFVDGGTYKLGTDLGLEGEDSVILNWNDNAATIEAALEGIFGAGNVAVEANTDFVITFPIDFGDSGLEFADIDLANATSPGLTLDTAAPTIYVRDTDYGVTVDSSGYTTITRIATGDIGTPETVYADYDYQPGVSGFKFKLYSEAARTNLMYELDTSQDTDWDAGFPVRDPNFGLLPVCYFIDNDENGQFYYTIENLDETLSSQFLVDMKYKALT